MEKAEGDVDGMGSKHCINSARDDRRLRDQLGLANMICVVWLRLARGYALLWSVRWDVIVGGSV